MAASATPVRPRNDIRKVAAAAILANEIQQLASGLAGYKKGLGASVLNDPTAWETEGQVAVPKTASIVLLDGGPLYWDRSAGAAHFKKVNDQDFLMGSVVGDAASADTTVGCNLNVPPVYTFDLATYPWTPVLVGTAVADGFNYPRRFGSAHQMLLSATNEAQKIDMFADDGFVTAANGILEFALKIVDGDAGGAADFNVGIASATHATDADSIAKHLFLHIDGSSTAIRFQSKDGATTVASTDSTKVYVVGTRFEVWLDMRDQTNVKIYVNGVRVLSTTTFDVSASASLWYLLAHLEKTASTDTFDGRVDWCRGRIAEQ